MGHFVPHKIISDHHRQSIGKVWSLMKRKRNLLSFQEKWLYHYIRERKLDSHETFLDSNALFQKQNKTNNGISNLR